MKYLIPALIILAVCCGCLDGRYRGGFMFPRPYQRTAPRRLAEPQGDEIAQAPSDAPPLMAPSEPAPEPPPLAQPDDTMPPEHTPVERPEPVPTDEDETIERTIERTHRRVQVRPRILEVKDKPVMPERFYAGFSMGNVYGNKGNAVHDLKSTDFENGMFSGLFVGYIPAMKKTNLSPHFATRYGIEFRLQDYALMLNNDGLDIGELNMTSAVFSFNFYQAPEEDNIFGFHVGVGLGWGWTWFSKADMLKQEDIDLGRHTSISVDRPLIYSFGAGIDLTLSPNACISLDLRYEDVEVPAKWSENGVYRRDIDRFDASNGQLILSLRWFF